MAPPLVPSSFLPSFFFLFFFFSSFQRMEGPSTKKRRVVEDSPSPPSADQEQHASNGNGTTGGDHAADPMEDDKELEEIVAEAVPKYFFFLSFFLFFFFLSRFAYSLMAGYGLYIEGAKGERCLVHGLGCISGLIFRWTDSVLAAGRNLIRIPFWSFDARYLLIFLHFLSFFYLCSSLSLPLLFLNLFFSFLFLFFLFSSHFLLCQEKEAQVRGGEEGSDPLGIPGEHGHLCPGGIAPQFSFLDPSFTLISHSLFFHNPSFRFLML